MEKTGPYFEGQVSNECGHYYPDVLRIGNQKLGPEKYIMIIDCKFCGRYNLPLKDDSDLIRALDIVGTIRNLSDEGIEFNREKELKRFANREQVPAKDLIRALIYTVKVKKLSKEKDRPN